MGSLLTLVAVCLLALGFVGGTPALGAVVLNEVMADPASDWSPTDGDDVYNSLDDEWVEILNPGPDAVDITGWRLRDASDDWRYGFTGVLPPGGRVTVYGNEAYDWEEANGFPKSGLSLNNSGDTVTLYAADLVTVVDTVTYTTAQTLDDRSYGRMPDGESGWAVFDGLNPMSPPATGLMPSPNMPNAASPVEDAAWGRIKAMFR